MPHGRLRRAHGLRRAGRRGRRRRRPAPASRAASPRSRVSGQTPTWTPDTTTMRHSRPGGTLRGQQRDGVIGRRPLDQRVTRHLLPAQVLQELARTGLGQPVDEPCGRVEQGHHGIEVTVGPGTGSPTGQGGPPPGLGQPGGVPDRPEHRLGVRTVGAGSGSAGREHPSHPPGRQRDRPRQRDDPVDLGHRLDQQLVRGPAAAARALLRPQRPAQPAHGHRVGPADRRARAAAAPGRDPAGPGRGWPRTRPAAGPRRSRPGPGARSPGPAPARRRRRARGAWSRPARCLAR